VELRHSLSSGRHYDPTNTSYGLLVACDEIALAPGAGFPAHRHRDLEVVSWVLEGELVHEGPTGPATTLGPGDVQVLGAGAGVLHAERAGRTPTRFVQCWLVAEPGAAVSYDVASHAPALAAGTLVPVASGLPGHAGALPLAGAAALLVARLPAGRSVALPAAPYLHVLVVRGEVELAGTGRLGPGDAARASGGRRPLSAAADAEVLVWEMHQALSADRG